MEKKNWPRIVRKAFFEGGHSAGISNGLLKGTWKLINGFRLTMKKGKTAQIEWYCDRPKDTFRFNNFEGWKDGIPEPPKPTH